MKPGTVLRYTLMERVVHWLAALSYIYLLLTGLAFFLPLLWWVVFLLAVWSVVAGDLPMLVVAVAAASFCAQTHVPYLAMSARISADPGDRFACVPFTCPAIASSRKSTEPSSAFTSVVRASTSIAAALAMPDAFLRATYARA